MSAFEHRIAEIAQCSGIDLADRPGERVEVVDKPPPDMPIIGKTAGRLVARGSHQGPDQLESAIGEDDMARLDMLRRATLGTNRHSVA